MNKDLNLSIIKTLFTGLANRLLISHTALEQLRFNENLTPSGLLNIKTIGLCYQHMNHLCRFADYLTSDRNTSFTENLCYFDSADFLSGITEAFKQTISEYISVTAICTSKLKTPQTIRVNKTKFETIFLNILYSCLKSVSASEYQKTKITLSVSETKKYLTFHIHTNNSSPTSEMIAETLATPHYFTPDIYSQDAVLALSLEIADMFVSELGGVLTCKVLKSGNRYDISLPKTYSEEVTRLCSPITYFPSYEHFEETFAEFKLLSLT